MRFRRVPSGDISRSGDAFDKSLQYDALDESLVEPLMDALGPILNVTRSDTASIGTSEWLDTSALLSPWKLAATTIEVQFSLKQIGERQGWPPDCQVHAPSYVDQGGGAQPWGTRGARTEGVPGLHVLGAQGATLGATPRMDYCGCAPRERTHDSAFISNAWRTLTFTLD